ncbi:MAG TPA: ABC transporter permease [Acidimicrobiales bacterium]|nr:ABC transporter permease [Acidimicrobiales bacterium]
MSWAGAGVSGNFDVIWHYTIENLRIAVLALLLGGVMAFPIGVLGYKRPHTYPAILVFSSVLYSVPSLAFFVLLYAAGVPLGEYLVIIPLGFYTLVILVRNIVEGLRAAPREVGDAATAMGYGQWRLLLTIEFPLAIPAIVAGFRVAAVSTISLVSVGALVGSGGLGQLFTDGFQRDISAEVLSGIAAVVVLAALFDAFLVGVQRVATPWARARR